MSNINAKQLRRQRMGRAATTRDTHSKKRLPYRVLLSQIIDIFKAFLQARL